MHYFMGNNGLIFLEKNFRVKFANDVIFKFTVWTTSMLLGVYVAPGHTEGKITVVYW